jgi:rSAM/selenodomain-associated transferase 1
VKTGNLYGIMVKYPEPGRVKTRLAKDIGEENAARICRRIAERILCNTKPLSGAYDRFVLYDPPERKKDFEEWLSGEHLLAQTGNDVGEKMDNAIRALLSMGAKKAVITGADIPDLNREVIVMAFESLTAADIVIGPAKDGGYYLIGMKSPHPELFHDIPWSTETVLGKTVGIISGGSLRYSTVPALSDLDTAEDLRRFC